MPGQIVAARGLPQMEVSMRVGTSTGKVFCRHRRHVVDADVTSSAQKLKTILFSILVHTEIYMLQKRQNYENNLHSKS